jgi:hypothetical protein
MGNFNGIAKYYMDLLRRRTRYDSFARGVMKLGTVSKTCVGIAVIAVLAWLMFATQGMPGRVACVYGEVHLSLYTHTVALVRVTPIPLAIGQAQHPQERGPFFSAASVLTVPYGAIAAVAMTVPIIEFALYVYRSRRAADRTHRGLCAMCGYDLRGSAGRCPECGAAATA